MADAEITEVVATTAVKRGKKLPDPVDRELLMRCITELDTSQLPKRKGSESGLPAQTPYLHALAELYNRLKPAEDKVISYTVIRLRIGEWGLDHSCEPAITKIKRGTNK